MVQETEETLVRGLQTVTTGPGLDLDLDLDLVDLVAQQRQPLTL